MAKQALYTLMENEEVVFELNIDAFETDEGKDGLLGIVSGLLEDIPIIGMLSNNKKNEGVFVVTNMRCIVATKGENRFFGCSCVENRNFVMYPRSALNGCNGYEKSRKLCCAGFSISIGVTVGCANETLTVGTNDIETDEQAQAVVAKLATLVQKA